MFGFKKTKNEDSAIDLVREKASKLRKSEQLKGKHADNAEQQAIIDQYNKQQEMINSLLADMNGKKD